MQINISKKKMVSKSSQITNHNKYLGGDEKIWPHSPENISADIKKLMPHPEKCGEH